jgi:hypothetical protein
MDSGDAREDYRMVLEDDVKPCKNLISHLSEYIQFISTNIGIKGVVVSLYNPFTHPVRNNNLLQVTVGAFYGTQAMLYSEDIRIGFAEYIRKNICKEPYDMLLKSYCIENRIPIYWVSLSLFQHMGIDSTGLGNYYKTGNFIDDILG